jgi:hypothetical protein
MSQQRPLPQARIKDAGAVAGRDLNVTGENAAGRDLYVQEGFRIKSKMSWSAKRLLKIGVFLVLLGMFVFGAFIVSFQSSIFNSFSSSDMPALPSYMPWVPLGLLLDFSGIVCIIVSLIMPRIPIEIYRPPGHAQQ